MEFLSHAQVRVCRLLHGPSIELLVLAEAHLGFPQPRNQVGDRRARRGRGRRSQVGSVLMFPFCPLLSFLALVLYSLFQSQQLTNLSTQIATTNGWSWWRSHLKDGIRRRGHQRQEQRWTQAAALERQEKNRKGFGADRELEGFGAERIWCDVGRAQEDLARRGCGAIWGEGMWRDFRLEQHL